MSRFGLTGCIVVVCGLLMGSASDGSAAARVGAGSGKLSASARLNTGGYARVTSISCAAPGDCAAGGFYYDRRRKKQAFVVTERDGSWGKASEVPGTATLNAGGGAWVNSISCAAAGDCAAGGTYTDGSSNQKAFVVSETSRRWGTAIEVPGTATPSSGGSARVSSISCAAPGDCAAGGYYTDGDGNEEAFVADETSGSWGNAIEVPGTATLNAGGRARVYSIACAAASECAADGYYTDSDGNEEAFVADETSGSWGNAIEVPGTATLNAGGYARVTSISCPAAGDCGAAGRYTDHGGFEQAFVASETSGSWGNAVEVPGRAMYPNGEDLPSGADTVSISCAEVGDCAAGGGYIDGRGDAQAFVVSETNGSWGKAIEVPGTATLNSGFAAGVGSVSCAAAGECAAGGYYSDYKQQAFVVSETKGSWGRAIRVPDTGQLNTGGIATVDSVSCAAASDCAAGGYYTGGYMIFGHTTNYGPRAYVAGEAKSSWGKAIQVFPAVCVVPNVVRKAISAAKWTLKAYDCRPGEIKTSYSTVKKGQVVAQRPKPGKHLKAGARVALTVSKGKTLAHPGSP